MNTTPITAKIGENEVPAFKSDITGLILVGLKDESGTPNLYSYKDGKYSLYKEYAFNKVILYPMELKLDEIFDNDFLSNQPILIVDDEGDQATLNTKAYLSSMSSTYESVLNLKSKLKKHCFLSITATPQANILIQTFDKLSPDFGELVYPGEGYCGRIILHRDDSH
jgi:hypothetical protein